MSDSNQSQIGDYEQSFGNDNRVLVRHGHRHNKRPGMAKIDVLVLILGALLTGAIVSSTLFATASPTTFEIDQISPFELNAARSSLGGKLAGAIFDDAKTCKVPLASVVVRSEGQSGGMIHIRSGAYVSPPLRLQPGIVRIALPYPAPYNTGHGQIIVEADDTPFSVFLKPGWHTVSVNGSSVVNVHWKVGNPC